MSEYNKHIEKLIQLFNNGLTSIDDENELYSFFESNNVPDYLKHYIPIFRYFGKGIAQDTEVLIPQKPARKKTFRLWLASTAAVIAIVLVCTFKQERFNPYKGSYVINNGVKSYEIDVLLELEDVNLKMKKKEQEIDRLLIKK